MWERRLAWGSACAVVLTAISAALINELHAGWFWWFAAAVTVLSGAGLAWWLVPAGRAAGGEQLGAGAVKAGRDIVAPVRTRVRGRAPGGAGDAPPNGAVQAGRDIRGEVRTDVDHRDGSPS